MSIGPMSGLPASVAGLPATQAKGSEADRGPQELAVRQREAYYAQTADEAASVGPTDGQDHETADRDADGRPGWTSSSETSCKRNPLPPNSRDPTGQRGSLLDLTG